MGFLEVARVEIVTFAKPVKNGVASGRDGGLSTGLFRRTLIEHSEIAPSSWNRGRTCHNFKGSAPPNASVPPYRQLPESIGTGKRSSTLRFACPTVNSR